MTGGVMKRGNLDREGRTQQEATETREETPFESEGRDWNDLSISQRKPAHPSSSFTPYPRPPKVGKACRFSLTAL